MFYLTADFGSTYTKLTAIDAEEFRILATSSAFTTIETNIMDGFYSALKKLETKLGKLHYDRILCCSSAGGGLKMVALGLVPELTAKAAKLAASSAGAKVVKTYSFEISHSEQIEIKDINPDVVLLCGGTDGGNKEVIIANARRLSEIDQDFSIIVAGNKSASYELEEILKSSGKDYVITDNVMPVFNHLNIEPAKQCIRDVFIRKIVDAKGLSEVQQMASGEIIPTPLAVMNACELLSKGTKNSPGIGELMAIDLGGATTDVYSMASGKPIAENVLVKGLPEPFSKRTVEGDLGMRYSLASLADELDMDCLGKEIGIDSQDIFQWITHCISNPDAVAATGSRELQMEEILARSAIELAVERHCGIMESAYSPMGIIFSITGKDLTEIPYIIGIGGILINNPHHEAILKGALFKPDKKNSLRPKSPKILLDKQYIFASMGLIGTLDPDLALHLMKEEININNNN
ncbi:MAG: glutamate mutase L [Dysgonamonadaceae bacterium]|jgi:uncharacterized protein (TIGR01319 family)|nr:glutamate mutase L [Dysgonamonadaceae bacterium]